MDIKNYVKRNVLAFKTQVLDPVYATKTELENLPSGGGTDVTIENTPIDFTNWESEVNN